MDQSSFVAIATLVAVFAGCAASCSRDDVPGHAVVPVSRPRPSAAVAPSKPKETTPKSKPGATAGPGYGPIDSDQVKKAVNPKGEHPYAGPVGAVRGVVKVTGDAAPARPDVVADMSQRCPASAKDFYGRLFREGKERRLADALVAVTGYQGFVPVEKDSVRIEVSDCSWHTRTIALTFGQHLEVYNTGRQAYMPKLAGASTRAILAAMPGSDPIRLYPTKPGRYALVDAMYDFMFADVLVVKYPTHAVTGLDGEFELKSIPVGPVTVTAFLPASLQSVERKVQVSAGKTAEVELTIEFDAQQNTPAKPKAVEPARRQGATPDIH